MLRFVNKLAFRQAVKKVKQPSKAKKLILAGFHQVRRTMTTTLDKKRTKMLIIALDVERNCFVNGTDFHVQELIKGA